MKLVARAVVTIAIAMAHGAGDAAPFALASDAQVVETLPQRIGASAASNRALRTQLARAPANMPLALRAAREAIDRARFAGDPRELGQSQAALAPWWSQVDPPEPVRLLRATPRQSQHDADGAFDDLGAGYKLPIGEVAVKLRNLTDKVYVTRSYGTGEQVLLGKPRALEVSYAAKF